MKAFLWMSALIVFLGTAGGVHGEDSHESVEPLGAADGTFPNPDEAVVSSQSGNVRVVLSKLSTDYSVRFRGERGRAEWGPFQDGNGSPSRLDVEKVYCFLYRDFDKREGLTVDERERLVVVAGTIRDSSTERLSKNSFFSLRKGFAAGQGKREFDNEVVIPFRGGELVCTSNFSHSRGITFGDIRKALGGAVKLE